MAMTEIRNDPAAWTESLKERALLWGAHLFGVADLSPRRDEIRDLFDAEMAAFPRGVSIAVFLPDAILDEVLEAPTLTYAASYGMANALLNHVAFRLNSVLEQAGYRSFPIPAAQIVGPMMDRGIFSHRLVAAEAGLGWIGKSCSLVHPEVGPRLRLATVLTDAPLIPGAPLPNRCGNCRKCADICPVGALLGRDYVAGEDRDQRLHFHLCDAYLLEKKKSLGEQVCGLCIAVCPYGRNGKKRREQPV